MKKLSMILVLLLLVSALFAQDFKVSVGAGAGYEVQNSNNNYDLLLGTVTGTNSTDIGLLNFGVFVDASYVLLSAKYATQLTQGVYNFSTVSPFVTTGSTAVDSGYSFIELAVAAKLPIQITEGLIIFPSIGLGYDINVAATGKDLMTDAQKAELDNLYLNIGVGADLYVSDNVFFRPALNFGYNLTNQPSVVVSGFNYSGYKLDLGLTVGVSF